MEGVDTTWNIGARLAVAMDNFIIVLVDIVSKRIIREFTDNAGSICDMESGGYVHLRLGYKPKREQKIPAFSQHRNKPKEPVQVPKNAPFFLSVVSGLKTFLTEDSDN
ncbi:hypothetical protein AVEN_176098-1 [Araneus ventricosus]|uniref:Uncharacterized protein n=1 Tax=Araneus ventricosus TaxID=182803 RepID=A0A4Y2SVQ8_ARAVE|nr:hypothetical protein AVEN_176098-1 [Araneus ventricosus]